MLRSAGFEIVLHPEQEVYFCRAAGEPACGGAVYPSKGPLHD
jgi:tRNA (mo5U34)-methyltransferase